MKHPDWLPLVVLALAAFRLTRLLGWDDLTITPRRWIAGLGDLEHHHWAHVIETAKQHDADAWDGIFMDRWTGWGEQGLPTLVTPDVIGPLDRDSSFIPPPPIPKWRFYISKLIRCPWCAGWWISLALWYGWWLWPGWTVALSVPFAVSAIVGLTAKNLDK